MASQKFTAYLDIRYYGFKVMLDVANSGSDRQFQIKDTYSSKPFICERAPNIKWQLDLCPFGSQDQNLSNNKIVFKLKQLDTQDNDGSSPVISAEVWVRLKNSKGESVQVDFEQMEGNVYVFTIGQSIAEACLHPNGSLFVESIVEYALPSTH